nr:testis-specific serine/threonine-protein kinase 3-like [Neodiprion pinetum]
MLHCIRSRANSGLLSEMSLRPSSSQVESSRFKDVGSNSIDLHLKDQGYTFGKTIGEGSYCKVKFFIFKTVYQRVGNNHIQKIACKIIDKCKASNEFVTKFLPRELSVVRGLRHSNIVTVLNVLSTPRHVYIFMDFCERGDLLDYIRAKGALTESRSRHFFKQIVSAVQHLHSLDIAHRDLKCENVLLTTKDHVKIADFGFARWCRDEKGHRILSDTFCGSAAYAAPEILQGTMYNPKMYDSWSLGCILFIMLTASMPFDDAHMPSMIRAQTNRLIKFNEKIQAGSTVCISWNQMLHDVQL